jgi:cardiolipin synthase
VFRRDLSQSRQISFEQWRERPRFEKVIEHAASLLGQQL